MIYYLCRHSSLFFTRSTAVGHHACPVCKPAVMKITSHKHNPTRLNCSKPTTWVVDSGATVHCVNDLKLLTSVYTNSKSVYIKVADKRVLEAQAVGTSIVSMVDDHGRRHQVTLHNVVYHPSF